MQPACCLETVLVVGLVGADVEQILLHAAYRTVDGHVVVVEDDEQVIGRGRHVVQTLEGQTARHGAVADDGHHLFLVPCSARLVVADPLLLCFQCFSFALHAFGHRHAESSRDAVGGVSAREGVVFALLRRGERHQSAQLSVRTESFSSPCQNFMSVGLVPDVPYDAVVRRVEHIVKSHCELHHAEARCQMSGVHRYLFDDVVAQFVAQQRQLVNAQFAQVGRPFDAVE